MRRHAISPRKTNTQKRHGHYSCFILLNFLGTYRFARATTCRIQTQERVHSGVSATNACTDKSNNVWVPFMPGARCSRSGSLKHHVVRSAASSHTTHMTIQAPCTSMLQVRTCMCCAQLHAQVFFKMFLRHRAAGVVAGTF